MSQVSASVDGVKQPANRRVYFRQPVRSLAYVELGEGNGGIVLNVSEGGIAVQAVMSLLSDELPCVRVQMAHSKKRIEAKGRITWTGGLRKTAGIEFIDLSQEARSLLREWVALEAPSKDFLEEMTDPIRKEDFSGLVENISAPAALETQPDPPVASAEPRLPSAPIEFPDPPEPFLTSAALRAPSAPQPISMAPSPVSPSASETPWVPFPVREAPAVDLPAIPIARPVPEPEAPAAAARGAASFVPPDRFGFKQAPAVKSTADAPAVEQRLRLPALVAIFAAVSLAAGWFAGHGALHGLFKKPATAASAEEVAADEDEDAPAATPKVSNIEVLDAKNRRWLIPMNGPLGASANPSPREAAIAATLLEPRKVISAETSSAPVQRDASSGENTPTMPSDNASTDSNSRAATALPGAAAPASSSGQDSGALQSGELLHRVEPVYPPSALSQRIEGTVTLYAVIDTDGTIKTLRSLDGPPALVPAALAAVRQWRYSPSLLNGQPIQTERQIKIVFQLSQPE
jgi:TonB family protein